MILPGVSDTDTLNYISSICGSGEIKTKNISVSGGKQSYSISQTKRRLFEDGELRTLKDKNVLAPIDYFALDDQELYVTPYINQARCIASYTKWGMYIPEPFYRFESFTKEQEFIVNTCMIAKLVSLYDHEKQEGICSCKIGGGDFMLPKGWENKFPTIENTLNNLYLIAARKKINCSYLEYLKILRSEFSRTTISEPQEDIIINLRGRVPMDINNIEAGIKLGEELNIKEKTINLRYK